jgi:molybdopterin converting factor small subunit
MKIPIQIKLYANLKQFTPPSADNYMVEKGMTIRQLLEKLKIPTDRIRLIFINNVKGELDSILKGEERVGIFPPIGGG